MGGIFLASTSICIAKRGLFCVAKCSKASPRPIVSVRTGNHNNVSGKHCPAPEAILFNLRLSFWYMGGGECRRGGSGVNFYHVNCINQ